MTIDLKASSGTNLQLLFENRLPLPLPIDSFLALNDLAFDWRPEVLYVGQSFEMLKRWRSHKQVNRATSKLGDDEELRLYYLHFLFMAEFERFGDPNWNHLLEVDDKTTPQYGDRISLLEQALIQYYRPALNTQLLDASSETAHIRRIAAKTGINAVRLSLGMKENAFQFFSAGQVMPDEVVTWDLATVPPSFRKGMNVPPDFVAPGGGENRSKAL